ncbi:MAG: serine/threonine-protein kinase [Sandaracinus sp.]
MGERFGEYEIEGRLGVGGMAEVYAARRSGPEGFVRRVCLKRVLEGNESDRDAVTQLQDEARLCAHLSHPSIATVHELGRVDGKWFLVMELVDGMDLRSLVAGLRQRGIALPTDVALHVVRSIAEGLAHAHALTIDGKPAELVHRDVTPSNVLLSIHGEVKLADFGIARSTLRTHRTRSGVVKGKIPYMAPEQALGDALDRRTDVFALGVMLFELLAGRRPHDGQTDLETLTNAQRGRRPSLRDLAPTTPEPVIALVNGMLAARAADRTASADEVVRVLAAVPAPRDARRALAALVDEVRRGRAGGAPPTRVRGPRVRATVDAGATPAIEEGPTVIERDLATSTGEGTAALQRSVRGPSTRLWLIGAFAGAAVLSTTLVVGLAALALGSGSIARALGGPPHGAASAPKIATPPSAPVIAAAETHEPTLPPAPPPAEQPAPSPAPVVEIPAPVRGHRTHVVHAHDAARAHLQVVAIPYGEVTIDGHSVGRTPVSVALAPGAHTVVVSNGETRGERHVSLDPGATQRVLVDLLGD